MTRSWSAGRRSEWSRTEKTAWSRCQRAARGRDGGLRVAETAGCAHLGLDDHVERRRRGLGADGRWAERAGEVEEGVGRRHALGGAVGRARPSGVVKGVGGGGAEMNCSCEVRLLASTDANIYFLGSITTSGRSRSLHDFCSFAAALNI